MKNLGEKIWRLREERGLSQEALAEKLDVSRQTVSNWENDKATPDAYKLRQLCEALGVSADELLETGDAAQESGPASPKQDAGLAGQKKDGRRIWRIVLLAVLGTAAALLLAVAVVLFTLPQGETQVITSAFTLTPTMGGIFLMAFSVCLFAAVAVILLKKK